VMKKLLVTGSSGLIGSEVVTYFDAKNWQVAASTTHATEFLRRARRHTWNQRRLAATCRHFTHYELDIPRARARFGARGPLKPDLIVHAAAQPSQRPGGVTPLSTTSRSMRRHEQPSRGHASLRPRSGLRAHVHQQGVRRSAQRGRHGASSTHAGTMPMRPVPMGSTRP